MNRKKTRDRHVEQNKLEEKRFFEECVELVRLRARIQKLRQALEKIADDHGFIEMRHVEMAREALAEDDKRGAQE